MCRPGVGVLSNGAAIINNLSELGGKQPVQFGTYILDTGLNRLN